MRTQNSVSVGSMLAAGFAVVLFSGCFATGPIAPTPMSDAGVMPPMMSDAGMAMPTADAAVPPMADAGSMPMPDAAVSPPADFTCILAGGSTRIGYMVRVCARGMTGVNTVPNTDGDSRPMTNSALRLWSLGLGAELDAPPGGCVDYDLRGRTGGINTHPFVDSWVVGTFDPADEDEILNIADLRPFVGRSAASIGLEAYACQDPSGCDSDDDWTVVPEEFYTVGPDTTAGGSGTYYCDGGTTSSVLHSSLCGQVPVRAVLYVSCTADHHIAR